MTNLCTVVLDYQVFREVLWAVEQHQILHRLGAQHELNIRIDPKYQTTLVNFSELIQVASTLRLGNPFLLIHSSAWTAGSCCTREIVWFFPCYFFFLNFFVSKRELDLIILENTSAITFDKVRLQNPISVAEIYQMHLASIKFIYLSIQMLTTPVNQVWKEPPFYLITQILWVWAYALFY